MSPLGEHERQSGSFLTAHESQTLSRAAFIYKIWYNINMSETYEGDPFILAYVKWHYGRGLKELFKVAGNFLWFVTNFFSFKLLLKTLFAPWKRLGEHYEGGLDLSALASTLIINGIMRTVGFITKTVVLLVGLVSYILVLIFSIFIFIIWVLAPVILLGSLILSITFFVI